MLAVVMAIMMTVKNVTMAFTIMVIPVLTVILVAYSIMLIIPVSWLHLLQTIVTTNKSYAQLVNMAFVEMVSKNIVRNAMMLTTILVMAATNAYLNILIQIMMMDFTVSPANMVIKFAITVLMTLLIFKEEQAVIFTIMDVDMIVNQCMDLNA